MSILDTDHTSLEHGRVLVHECLDLAGPYLETRGVDHALQAIDHEEIAVFIDPAEIPGA